MKIVFLDSDSLNRGDMDFTALENLGEHYVSWPHTSPEQLLERLSDASVVITNKVVLGDTVISQLSNLKLICVAATGTNNVDLKSAKQNSIEVCNVTGYATASVVQHVFACVTSLYSRLNEHQEAAISGDWSNGSDFCVLDYPFQELSGKVMGIIGYGELGKAVASLAECFGMKVVIAKSFIDSNASSSRVELDDLLRQSDVISLHCPLADNTHHLIDAKAFDKMKATALLINTARGGIVNEIDLLVALKRGDIAGAALDVLEAEPPPSNHALFQYDKSNLIITPHVAWASRESRQRLVDQLVLNIQSFMEGNDGY